MATKCLILTLVRSNATEKIQEDRKAEIKNWSFAIQLLAGEQQIVQNYWHNQQLDKSIQKLRDVQIKFMRH